MRNNLCINRIRFISLFLRSYVCVLPFGEILENARSSTDRFYEIMSFLELTIYINVANFWKCPTVLVAIGWNYVEVCDGKNIM